MTNIWQHHRAPPLSMSLPSPFFKFGNAPWRPIGPRFSKADGISFFVLAHCTFFHIHSSLLTYFLFSFFIFTVPMVKCLGNHSCVSSTFPIAILNGTYFFREAK